jgi:hypothetical protein
MHEPQEARAIHVCARSSDHLGPATAPLRAPRIPVGGGVCKQKRADEIRPLERGTERDTPAHGEAGEVRARDTERGENRRKIFDMRIWPGGKRRAAIAAQVIADGEARARGEGKRLVPHARVEPEAVDEDDRRARAGGFDVKSGNAPIAVMVRQAHHDGA